MNYYIYIVIFVGLFELKLGMEQIINYWGAELIHHVRGTFHNSGLYAGFISIIFPLALYILLNIKRDNTRESRKTVLLYYSKVVISTSYILGALIVIPYTQSRAAFAALSIGTIIILLEQFNLKDKISNCWRKHKFKAFFLSSLLIVSTILIGNELYFFKKNSADGRILIWKNSLSIMKEKPLTGIGTNKFAANYREAQANYFRLQLTTEHEKMIAGAPEHAFNEFIQITIEYGLIGFLFFCGVIIYGVINLKKSNIKEAKAILASLISMLIFAFFSYPFRVFPLCLLSVSIIAISVVFPRKKCNHIFHRIFSLLIISIPMILICISFRIFDLNFQKANEKWDETVSLYNEGEFSKVVSIYSLLYPYLKMNPDFLFEYGQCLSQVGRFLESNTILSQGASLSSDPMFFNIMGKNHQAMLQYQQAEQCYIHSTHIIPHRIYPIYLLMNLYKETGQISEAYKTAEKIINKKIKIPSKAIETMKSEALLFKKEVDELN